MHNMRKLAALSLVALALVLGSSTVFIPAVRGQAGLSTGSIQGTILDPNGASVPDGKVTITSKATGQSTTPQVTSTGEYSSGPLTPGVYVLKIEAPNFKVVEETITVQVGRVSSG